MASRFAIRAAVRTVSTALLVSISGALRIALQLSQQLLYAIVGGVPRLKGDTT